MLIQQPKFYSMKKALFITAVILAAFANRSIALNKLITGNYVFYG